MPLRQGIAVTGALNQHGEGLALLTGMPSGIEDPVTTQGPYPADSVLSLCEGQLRQFREACRAAGRGTRTNCP